MGTIRRFCGFLFTVDLGGNSKTYRSTFMMCTEEEMRQIVYFLTIINIQTAKKKKKKSWQNSTTLSMVLDPVVSCQGFDVKFKSIINVSEGENTFVF